MKNGVLRYRVFNPHLFHERCAAYSNYFALDGCFGGFRPGFLGPGCLIRGCRAFPAVEGGDVLVGLVAAAAVADGAAALRGAVGACVYHALSLRKDAEQDKNKMST